MPHNGVSREARCMRPNVILLMGSVQTVALVLRSRKAQESERAEFSDCLELSLNCVMCTVSGIACA